MAIPPTERAPMKIQCQLSRHSSGIAPHVGVKNVGYTGLTYTLEPDISLVSV